MFTSDAQIQNRNSPAGSDLTPMEYTLMMIVEEKGNEVIPGFTPGSTTISTNGMLNYKIRTKIHSVRGII